MSLTAKKGKRETALDWLSPLELSLEATNSKSSPQGGQFAYFEYLQHEGLASSLTHI